MKLTIIGCGSIDLQRHSSSYLITSGKDMLLFDMGRGTLDNLKKLKIDPYSIERIFLTHFHTDHVIELAPFINAVTHNPENKTLKDKYIIYGPEDIKERIGLMLSAFKLSEEKFSKHFEIIELQVNQSINLEKIVIKTYPVKHTGKVKSISYRITANGKSIFYSGDTSKTDELIEGCKNAEVAILDSTMHNNKDHMSGKDAGEIARDANVKKLILTHTALDYLKDVAKDAKKSYKGEIILAKELLEIKI